MTKNKHQTQMKAIAILIGIIGLIVAMNESMYVFFAALITPVLWVAYGIIYLILIRNQKKDMSNDSNSGTR